MTSTAVAPTQPAGALAHPPGYDPYAAYGEQASAVKVYITFKNGEYLYGAEDELIPLGTRFIANMPGLRVGWKRWSAGRVTDDLLDLLAVGGRLITIAGEEPIMQAHLVTRISDTALRRTTPWDANAPRLHGFAEDSHFHF